MFDRTKLNANTWTEDDLGIVDAGDVGGDIQISDAPSRRFAQTLDNGQFAVLDFAAYVASEDENRFEDDVIPEDAWVQIQVYYGHCTDLDDAGGTETHGDYRYWDDHELSTLDQARQRIAKLTKEDLSEAVNQMGV